MDRIFSISCQDWAAPFSQMEQDAALQALEGGQVLFFPSMAFPLSPVESRLLDPAILSRNKNVSYNAATRALGGTVCRGAEATVLKALLHRYADAALGLLQQLLSHYEPALQRERTSLRPAAIEGRASSWRKDDTRLHVDSFPSAPVQGRRILRLFCNVNPHGRPRTWRVGEPFPDVAERFWSRLARPSVIKRRLLHLFRVTRELRSEYDHYMGELHDAMKADVTYQQAAPQETIPFPAGSAWACFADQVSHAAMAGQHQFEQTFTLPVGGMKSPATSPLAVLERLAGRPLVARRLAA